MVNTMESVERASYHPLGTVQAYLGLCKVRVVSLIVFTAMVGMFLATPGMVPWHVLIFGTLGIWLAASSAAAFNHVLDRRADAGMCRTRGRPLPTGRVSTSHALAFAFVLAVASMAVLVTQINTLTAFLTFLSLIGYAVIYTVFLKRATPQNIVIGGAAGAAPPVLGWAAVTGHLDPNALLLFLIIFTWTPPHFWSLAIARRNDYAKVGVPMLPVVYGVEYTCLHILLYTLLLVGISVLPFASHMSGLFYLGGALGLGGVFVSQAVRLMRMKDDRQAMRTFGYSIVYLMLLFAFLLVDHYLPLMSGWWS